MRKRAPLSVLLFAAGAMPAAAPGQSVTTPADAEVRAYRSRGYPICLAVNPLVARDGTVNQSAIEQCWCAVDELIGEGRIDDLRRLDERNVGALLGPALERCRNGTAAAVKIPTVVPPPVRKVGRSDDPADAARDRADALEDRANAVQEAAAIGSKPTESETEPAGTEPNPPAWLAWTGLPAWALWLFPIVAALAGLVLLLTRRRRGGPGDLTGPPPSMRGDAEVRPRPRE